jgi:hypothetical protein
LRCLLENKHLTQARSAMLHFGCGSAALCASVCESVAEIEFFGIIGDSLLQSNFQ